MTNPTPHGQVPEALIDLIDAYAETRHRYGGIYNAKTEAARNAVIEALSGVQALSAAPAVPAGWKAVPVNPTPEMWKAAKTVPDPNPPYPPHYGLVWDAMLAATPTPPAEQQAAPKAAPEVGNSGFDYKTAADFLNGKTVSDEAVRKFVAASRWAHDERAALSATLLAMHGVLTSREAEIAHLKKALLEAEAAPQQEAQEPVAWLNPWRADQVTTDYEAYGERGIPLYTAPQPSPAAQGDAIEHELAMLIRRIVSSARRNCEDGSNVLKLANEAWTYLVRKGLNGSPLRDAGIESDPTPPAKAADSVQEDAALWHWLAKYLVGTRTDLDDEIVASKTVNDLRKLVKAARKQGENHDR